ncbi:hypothetical protein [Nocardia sp. NPDC056000]|uniref:WXG100-like domain-containing protein n=1 Tax=Nocardia sp. NPDC056000 TaxID=3345674 RepID=UPI0035E1207D
MAIEIPHEVALFLNYAGVPYPDINEDQVRELATHVRNFASKVRGTHDAATGAIKEMNGVWSGYSYEQLLTVWARMSATHMAELDRACKVVAVALNTAADVIVVTKVAVLGELAAMATTYLAAMAGTFATGGLSAVVAQSLPAMASKLVSVMEQVLIAYILAEVLGKAIEPLGDLIERMVGGALHAAVVDMLDLPPSPSSSTTQPMRIEPDEVLRYADLLDSYADEMLSHAKDFADRVGGLDFTTASGRDLEDAAGDPGPNSLAGTVPHVPGSTPASDLPTRPMPQEYPAARFESGVRTPSDTGRPVEPSRAPSESSARPTLPANAPGVNPATRPGVSTSAPERVSAGSNPYVSAPKSAAPVAPSPMSQPSSSPWRENSGTPREPSVIESSPSSDARANQSTAAVPSAEPIESPGAATSSGAVPSSSQVTVPTPSSAEERMILGPDPTADTLAAGGQDRESAVRQPDPMGSGVPANLRQGTNPWGGPLPRRRSARAARAAQRERPTIAASDSRTPERGIAATPERGVVPAADRGVTATPWSKRVRDSDSATKVFTPEASSPAPPVPAPLRPRKARARRDDPAGGPDMPQDRASERRGER